ncbi:MAG: ribonuclease E/G [Rhodobacteraceae bacterium]|nr:ribonuclease E/G [Paracoccaceae bacterium]
MHDHLYHAQNKKGIGLSAWVRRGKLEDLFLSDTTIGNFIPESIFWGKVQKSLKGTGGYFISLPEGRVGFLRNSPPLQEGEMILVQVNGYPQQNKHVSLQSRIIIKGKGIILTQGVPGINISKTISNPERRQALLTKVEEALAHADFKQDDTGVIIRTSCGRSDHNIKQEIEGLLVTLEKIRQIQKPSKPILVATGPSVHERAERDWLPDQHFVVQDVGDQIDDFGLWDLIFDNTKEKVELGNNASLYIEKTHAMIVIDVNSGGINSKQSAKRISMEAVEIIPRELRLRGYGGKVTIDFPSMNKSDMNDVEKRLNLVFKNDNVPTKLIGWTKSGNYELQRKRDRLPVNEIFNI